MFHSTNPIASISIREFMGNAVTCTADLAGGSFGKKPSNTSFTCAKYERSVKNTVNFTAHCNELPPPFNTPSKLFNTWWTSALKSSEINSPLWGFIGIYPEVKTRFPDLIPCE